MCNAADVVNAVDEESLTSILSTYGEERYARKIASAIGAARCISPITRTQQLASIVAGAFSSYALYARRDLLQRPSHIATKTFQALRIFVNDELHELYAGLQAAEALLMCGGRICTLTFHSLEDRVVKRFLHGLDVAAPPCHNRRQRLHRTTIQGHPQEQEEDKEVRQEESVSKHVRWACLEKKVVVPMEDEVRQNPRGRSAKLRAAVKL